MEDDEKRKNKEVESLKVRVRDATIGKHERPLEHNLL